MATVHDDPLILNWDLDHYTPPLEMYAAVGVDPTVPLADRDPSAGWIDPSDDRGGPALAELAPPAPEPADPGLLPSFDAWLDAQAAYYRSQEGSAAEYLAAKIDELAARCRRLQATTPLDLDARSELEDAWRDEELRQIDRRIVQSHAAAERTNRAFGLEMDEHDQMLVALMHASAVAARCNRPELERRLDTMIATL